jgi:hypothetical protein
MTDETRGPDGEETARAAEPEVVRIAGTGAAPDPAPSAPARRSWRDLIRRPGYAAAVALGAVALVLGVGALVPVPSRPSGSSATAVPVASAELVCPVTYATNALVSTVSAGVAPLPSVEAGVATLGELTPTTPTTPTSVITKPGTTVSRTIRAKPGPALLARATGSYATGFGADQIIRSGQGASRGLAASPCARPTTDGWLVGGASTVGRITQVLLVNDDDRPAQVDLLVYGPEGLVASPAGTGIVLSPSSRRQVRLDTLAPNQAVTAVNVVARSGRIGFVGLDTAANGLIPLGMAILPVTQAGTRLVIADVPAPISSARLYVLAPETDATVAVKLLTADGAITPVGLEQLDLQAGRLLGLDLLPVLDGQAVGIVLESDQEIVAGVTAGTGAGAELRERDALGAGVPLNAPGIVVGLAGGALKHTLALTAASGRGSVDLAVYVPGATAAQWTSSVTVEEGTSVRVPVPVTTTTASSILVITPTSGAPLVVARETREAGARGPMLALAPVLPSRSSTLVPPVVNLPGSSTR